jgi:hypothetical protein
MLHMYVRIVHIRVARFFLVQNIPKREKYTQIGANYTKRSTLYEMAVKYHKW